MTRYNVAVLACMAALLALLACGGPSSDSLEARLRQARASLETGEGLQPESPFAPRAFAPAIDGAPTLRGVAYGCHRSGQAPWGKQPTRDNLAEDLGVIARHWRLLRVYNADDNAETMLDIIAEQGLPLHVMLGVWLDNETGDPAARQSNTENALRAVELANRYPQIVAAVSVGNETQVAWSAHRMAQSDLVRYVRAVRQNVTQPVTVADDYNFWNRPESRPVADEVDFLVVHAHPLWNGKTLATACDWLGDTLDEVAVMHPQRRIVLGETGWATSYNPDKKGPGEQGTLVKGEVSAPAQQQFLVSLDHWIDARRTVTFLFEAFDEPWKGGADATGPEEIEKNWGVFYETRLPKPSFTHFIENTETTDTYKARGE